MADVHRGHLRPIASVLVLRTGTAPSRMQREDEAMPAATLQEIRRPGDLEIPEATAAVLDELSGLLTDGERRSFMRQIVDALMEARRRDDLRPVQDVVESWHRTLLFRASPGHDEAMAEEPLGPPEGYTYEQARLLLGLVQPQTR